MSSAREVFESLRPRTKSNVMDLLSAAGQDVQHWSWNANGSPVAIPAANPNYCYDWSFGSTADGIVLCVWHDSIQIDREFLIFVENMRALDISLSEVAGSAGRSSKDRDRARQQAARARAFDALIQVAFERMLAVSFILNEGDRAKGEEIGAASATVSKRTLDTESWYVHKYDERTGECRIVRGIKPARDIVDDEVEDALDEHLGSEDRRQLKAINVRRGQRDFRDRVLAAWKRRCVVTESRVEGLLEAAHIVPHSEVTDYRTSNGLLLRADIHTLYDLGLLSIDQHMRVHLAPELMVSEYKQYAGKRIERRPEAGADAPSQDALSRRHSQFQESQST